MDEWYIKCEELQVDNEKIINNAEKIFSIIHGVAMSTALPAYTVYTIFMDSITRLQRIYDQKESPQAISTSLRNNLEPETLNEVIRLLLADGMEMEY